MGTSGHRIKALKDHFFSPQQQLAALRTLCMVSLWFAAPCSLGLRERDRSPGETRKGQDVFGWREKGGREVGFPR